MYKRIASIVIVVFLISSCSVWKKTIRFLGLSNVPIETNYSIREVDQLIQSGLSYRGIPYRTGGVDRKGMDCSGLLFRIYTDQHFQIPRLSKDQAQFGLPISIQEAQVGDWIFFATSQTKVINHSGIISQIKSANEVYFLHASTSKGVREDNLYTKYWLGSFVKIIRPFKN
ncbi:NlpC/P60 family protein [Cytophagaceae bacterium 50C-KIRBA]|uniref:NlpC/P60 family protein n=1 Tax=Aquirufa beregesia TaxID=2516556 RepID=A0ABX0EUZ8_9BACT|nr:C40 family peptidase [Aquirufa beregesia]NGZ43097.1 NlpC/P60 family protein [Aquirufa beregesia]